MSEETQGDFFRSRIVKFEYVDADTLTPYPLNPRRHPRKQREAVKAMLDEFGWLAPLTVNINNGYIFDGEERAWQATQQSGKVPVMFVDISEEEHARAIQYFDETGAMALYDMQRLKELQAIVLPEENDALAKLQVYIQARAQAEEQPDFQPVNGDEQPRLDELEPVYCPHCGANIRDKPES